MFTLKAIVTLLLPLLLPQLKMIRSYALRYLGAYLPCLHLVKRDIIEVLHLSYTCKNKKGEYCETS